MKKRFLAALVAVLSVVVFILPIVACAKKHEAKAEWERDNEKHWHACTACTDEVFDEGAHDYKTVDGVKRCETCGYEHRAKTEWERDNEKHWHACTTCNEVIFDEAAHDLKTVDGVKKCEICGFERAYTDEEAYSLWRVGIAAALSYEGDYTLTYKRKETDVNGKVVLDRDCQQARSTNDDYYSYDYDYEDYDGSGTLKESMREIILASAETTGILYNYYIKYYDETDGKFVTKNEEKTITSAELDEEAYMSPKGLC